MPRVIVCDVNETLLDLGALEPHFKQAFGDGRVLQDWFANVLLYSEVATLAGPYADFASIGGAALDMVASARGITLSSADRSRILQGMLTLPAHPGCAGRSSDHARCRAEARHADELRAGCGPAAARQRRPDRLLRGFILGGHRASLQASRRGVSVGRRFAWTSDRSTSTRGRACVGHRWRAPCGMRRSLRRPAGEGPVSARSEAGHHWTGFPERRETDRRGRSSPSLICCSTATHGTARRRPAAEPVFRLGRRFVGPVAFSSATRSPRDSHVRSAAAVRKTGGETYTNPLSGLPVKSIGRTCRLRMTASNSSSGFAPSDRFRRCRSTSDRGRGRRGHRTSCVR